MKSVLVGLLQKIRKEMVSAFLSLISWSIGHTWVYSGSVEPINMG